MFLKRKNTKKEEETPTTTLQTTPTVSSEENIKASLTQMQTILNQNTQPDLLMQDTTTIAQHLNNIAITTKKIQELQTALKTEHEHLNKNVDELNQTITKQEKIIKNYYDTIRNEVKKAQQHANNQNTPTTEQKEDKN
jgi:ABC-type transporter Mla subunit MlaD